MRYLLCKSKQATPSGQADRQHSDGHADAGGIRRPDGAADGLGDLRTLDHRELGEGELPDAEGARGCLGVSAELRRIHSCIRA